MSIAGKALAPFDESVADGNWMGIGGISTDCEADSERMQIRNMTLPMHMIEYLPTIPCERLKGHALRVRAIKPASKSAQNINTNQQEFPGNNQEFPGTYEDY